MTTLVLPWQIFLISGTGKVNVRCLKKTKLALHPFRSKPCSRFMASAAQSSNQDASKDVDVSHLIQTHQKKASRLPPVDQLRTILDASGRGMLSTFSEKYAGYPSGSMVDFACDTDGSPILAISNLAVHSKDLLANPKCSLLVARDPDDRTDIVITLHGDVIPVAEADKESTRSAYLRRHPNAFWVDFGDFKFVHIKPKVVRCVSGIATALLESGEFNQEEYQAAKVDPIAQFSRRVASHMNKDHAEDTKSIVQHTTSIPTITERLRIQVGRARSNSSVFLSNLLKCKR